MSRTSLCGLADLVRAMADDGGTALDAVASVLGYERLPDEPIPRRSTPTGEGQGAMGEGQPLELATVEEELHPSLRPGSFWRLEQYAQRKKKDGKKDPIPEEMGHVPEWENRPSSPPRYRLLAPWRELQPRLRRGLTHWREGHETDVGRLVQDVGQGRLIRRIPRRMRRFWGDTLQVVMDRSEHLAPFWMDQQQVHGALVQLFGAHHVELAVFHEGLDQPRMAERRTRHYRPPSMGGTVLVLGDMGGLLHGNGQGCHPWIELGQQLKSLGVRAVALFPGPLARCPQSLRTHWEVIPWERPRGGASLSPAVLHARAKRLLRLVSPAVRIEPGLLRAVRLSLKESEADAGTEVDVWSHSAVSSTSCVAATLDPLVAQELRSEFDQVEGKGVQAMVLNHLRQWRWDLPPEIMADEFINLGPQARGNLLEPGDLAFARAFLGHFSHRLSVGKDRTGKGQLAEKAWFRRLKNRSSYQLWCDPQVGETMIRLDWRLYHHEPGYEPPPGFDPNMIDAPEDLLEQPITLELRHRGNRLLLGDLPGGGGGSLLGRISSANGLITLQELAANAQKKRDPLFWHGSVPPSWADAWGWDGYGAWVEFVVAGVRQRLRWIPPGRFRMGSPGDEPGRWDDEGPQHDVTIAQGYWMFDTPCTQALWQAVMGENPSEFQSPLRPVEHVSFEDVQAFLEGIEKQLPGLGLTLPSEAQWEYACRAGTTTALYTGEMEILGDNNAPALDAIAWYGGNSGKGFDLEKGYDSKGWPEKQFDHERAGTRVVAQKAPNPLGLHDMLGNVLEWCVDAWHGSYAGAPTDGGPWVGDQARAQRVVRGGSWDDNARLVRSAIRNHLGPSNRVSNLGFRCIRVQVSPAGQAGQGVQPEDPLHRAIPAGQARQGAEPGEARGATGAAVLLDLKAGAEKSASPLPQGTHFHVQSDSETLTFGRITRPRWADAMGRDRFGLWAVLVIEPKKSPPVTQKMRWIPPGRFLMGSPKDEPGRFDVEGPQHEVMIQEGYWMFDTPCTQALWQAVMGENPSEFQSPLRPVEQVSFEDVQAFLEGIEKQLPGLGLTLPSEAQWEYACRAGTTTALYTGAIKILGKFNAPALDAIAWYGGNSGKGFDLEQGEDSKDWKEKQYAHERAGTRVVGQKAPNLWGMYDMLGNVWEWCVDTWHDSYKGAPTNGRPWMGDQAPARRVVRGGSWDVSARYVRSAIRVHIEPSNRGSRLGFRCIRVQG